MKAHLLFASLILLLVSVTATARSLTGVWRCDDGGTYWVRQTGDEVFWYGRSGDQGASWTNVFHGSINGDNMSGKWADVPNGAERQAGELDLSVESGNRFAATRKTGNFRGSVWSRGSV